MFFENKIIYLSTSIYVSCGFQGNDKKITDIYLKKVHQCPYTVDDLRAVYLRKSQFSINLWTNDCKIDILLDYRCTLHQSLWGMSVPACPRHILESPVCCVQS